ncbi:unnamed protein product [Cercopithifilaria johnstoni]|uniref:Uncharacterized protein n=1 Tax=Cercopithifilaria johnstoni TaxID=2874296 RepID=A0A8J2M896_9BILA|nr:unnamed protein product [Cercopithifilaria johnstoni]
MYKKAAFKKALANMDLGLMSSEMEGNVTVSNVALSIAQKDRSNHSSLDLKSLGSICIIRRRRWKMKNGTDMKDALPCYI